MTEVKVYSTPECPTCKKVKRFLKENNVEYQNIDVASDGAAAEVMIEKSGQMSVPVVEIDNELILGFDKKKLKNALNL